MNESRESRVYLNFFKQNLLIILTFGILGILIGALVSQKLPTEFHKSILMEISHSSSDTSERYIQVGEAVTLIRDESFQQKIGLDQSDKILAFTPGPLLLLIDVGNKDQQKVDKELYKLTDYFQKNFGFGQITDIQVYEKKSPFILLSVLGFFSGSLLGICASLAKFYWKNY